ncbi:hypothetical protein BUALT_Bualt17G0090200 [Buddleja alternifolia]|uniref:KIB1-4 beta-propeller domain-containing protein n=1 Tax=Buddleja alternifolia TaxID=168488 RepID=A0AAV6WDT6_9LAMI|nr:hypothetical protein BUALT_Bualt17G0090200 [Buddleja alternifolia]
METPCCYPPTDSDQSHPWLMVSQGMKRHTFYSISENQYFERCVPEFCDKQVAPTSYEWVTLFDHSISPIHCCLFNSESREKIQIPPIELPPESKRHLFYRCILSKPPNDPDCHVLLLPNDNFRLFCRLGDDKFVRRSNTFGDDYFSIATNFNGKLYAWMRRFVGSYSLVEVDFVGQELILKQLVNDNGQPCQISLPTKGCCFNDYLVESCGELLLVNKLSDWRLQKVKHFKISK